MSLKLRISFFLFLFVLPASSLNVRNSGNWGDDPVGDTSDPVPNLHHHHHRGIKLVRRRPANWEPGMQREKVIALEIAGCLAPLNTDYIQEGIKENIKEIKALEWHVDIYGAVKACNMEEEPLMPRTASVFKSLCSDCLIKVDALPTDYHVWGHDKPLGFTLPHLREYDKRIDLTGPAFVQREIIRRLREKTDGYPVIFAMNSDLRMEGLKWKHLLKQAFADNNLFFVPSKPFINGMLPDLPLIAGSNAIGYHDQIFNDLERYYEDGEITLDDDEATILDHNRFHMNAGIGALQCHAMRNVTTTKCINAANGKCGSITNFDSFPEAHLAKCPMWNETEGCQSHGATDDIYHEGVSCDGMRTWDPVTDDPED